MLGRIFTVGGYTLLSRLTGFARDIMLAAILGAGPVADAFFVALRLPTIFVRFSPRAPSTPPSFRPMPTSMARAARLRRGCSPIASLPCCFLAGVLLVVALLFMPQAMSILGAGLYRRARAAPRSRSS